MRRCGLFIFALILAVPLWFYQAHGGDTQPTEYQLKAAYIYHFAQFVTWPAAAFAETNSPLVIGVLGANPFGNDLQRTVEGKVLGGHPLVVKNFNTLSEITNVCHILFISETDRKRLTQIIAGLNGTSTLTVGESDRFIESGGMIRFFIEDTRIRFEINKTLVDKSGLTMSFKLLGLASHRF